MNSYDFYITPEEYEIAENNGITRNTLEKRIRLYGWSKEKALTEPPQKHTNRDSWLKVALENGINKRTFFGRINKSGWTEEKAATTPVVKTAIRNRKYSDELYKTLEENGISKTLFYDRIRKGWTIERASTEHVYTNLEKAEYLKKCTSYFKKINNADWIIRNNGESRKAIV